MRILCVVGTRPEAVKVAPVVQALRQRPERPAVTLMSTGQHRHLVEPMLGAFGLSPDVDLAVMQQGQSLSDIAARVLTGMHAYLAATPQDVVLAQGDTTTVMATAVACFHTRTAFAHLEAGLRTGDRWAPYPEEFNRRVAALAATHHLAPTAWSARNLLREGVAPADVYVTGNTVIDAMRHILATTPPPPRPLPTGARYVLVTCHRREIFGAGIREVFATLRDYARRHRDTWLWYPVHPNPEVSGPARELLGGEPNVLLTEPLGYAAFLHAMQGAWLLLTDSGGVQEEAPALGKPVLVLRDVTERPEGVEAGTCRLVGPHRGRIEVALEELTRSDELYRRMATARNPYGDGGSAPRVASILLGDQPERWRPAGTD